MGRMLEYGFCGNISDIVYEIGSNLATQKTIGSRNGKCRELDGVTLEYSPDNLYISKYRKDHYITKVFETFWVLSGNNKIDKLSYFMPRAVDYSDDGKTWSGAYGERIRNRKDTSIDQLSFCKKMLLQDKETRRAVVSLLDPNRDTLPTKDMPCNNILQFLIRRGELNLHVYQRSCDFIWGFLGANYFEWMFLLRFMHQELSKFGSYKGLKLGGILHHFGSLHVYKKHWWLLNKLINDNNPEFSIYVPEHRTAQLAMLDYPHHFYTSFDGMDNPLNINMAHNICEHLHHTFSNPKAMYDIDTNISNRHVVESVALKLWAVQNRQPYTYEIWRELCNHPIIKKQMKSKNPKFVR